MSFDDRKHHPSLKACAHVRTAVIFQSTVHMSIADLLVLLLLMHHGQVLEDSSPTIPASETHSLNQPPHAKLRRSELCNCILQPCDRLCWLTRGQKLEPALNFFKWIRTLDLTDGRQGHDCTDWAVTYFSPYMREQPTTETLVHDNRPKVCVCYSRLFKRLSCEQGSFWLESCLLQTIGTVSLIP